MIFVIFALFQVKHFLIDFVFQPPFEWKNKGSYGHLEGINHSLKHAIATMVILLYWTPSHSMSLLIIWLTYFDLITHYHIDWAKMNINSHFKLTPDKEKFWIMLGLDQLLHQLTMIAIIGIFVGSV